MTAYELIDIAATTANRIDVQWALFVTVHLALFGGIIYVDRPLRKIEKVAAGIIYAGFALLNYIVISRQLMLGDQIYLEIAKLAQDNCCQDNAIIAFMADEYKHGRFTRSMLSVKIMHGVMLLLVFVAIVFDRAIINKDADNSDEDSSSSKE